MRYTCVENSSIDKPEAMNHCQVAGIKICTRCGSINIRIDGDMIMCNDCNAILCYEHKQF